MCVYTLQLLSNSEYNNNVSMEIETFLKNNNTYLVYKNCVCILAILLDMQVGFNTKASLPLFCAEFNDVLYRKLDLSNDS